MKKILFSTALAGLLLTPTIFSGQNETTGSMGKGSKCACSQQSMCQNKHLYELGGIPMFQKLNLSADQKKQVNAITQQYMPQSDAINQKMKDNFIGLQGLARENYNERKIKNLANEQGEVIAEKIQLSMKIRHELYNVLTDKQKLEFTAMVRKHMADRIDKK